MAFQQHDDDRVSTESKFSSLNHDHDKLKNGRGRPVSYQQAVDTGNK